MKMKISRFVVVHKICSLSPGDELSINYNFCRPPIAHRRGIALGLRLDIPFGRKTKNINFNCICQFTMGDMLMYCSV